MIGAYHAQLCEPLFVLRRTPSVSRVLKIKVKAVKMSWPQEGYRCCDKLFHILWNSGRIDQWWLMFWYITLLVEDNDKCLWIISGEIICICLWRVPWGFISQEPKYIQQQYTNFIFKACVELQNLIRSGIVSSMKTDLWSWAWWSCSLYQRPSLPQPAVWAYQCVRH